MGFSPSLLAACVRAPSGIATLAGHDASLRLDGDIAAMAIGGAADTEVFLPTLSCWGAVRKWASEA